MGQQFEGRGDRWFPPHFFFLRMRNKTVQQPSQKGNQRGSLSVGASMTKKSIVTIQARAFSDHGKTSVTALGFRRREVVDDVGACREGGKKDARPSRTVSKYQKTEKNRSAGQSEGPRKGKGKGKQSGFIYKISMHHQGGGEGENIVLENSDVRK